MNPNHPLWTSDRERFLWTATLLVLLAIFSTLWLATSLTHIFHGFGGVVFFLTGMILVLASVVTQGLKARPRGIEIGVALGVVAAYLLVYVRMAIPTERSHLIEYSVVAALIHAALRERTENGYPPSHPAWTALLTTVGIGCVDEAAQRFIPQRVFDWEDIIFNSLAAAMSVTAGSTLSWVRNLQTGSTKRFSARSRSET
jgi:peptidoglycan/LPS O-acetylase OafA/YrhL